MEILAIYLYGVYGGIKALAVVSMLTVGLITIVFLVIYIAQKSNYEVNNHKAETSHYYKDALPEYKASYEQAKKFIFIKTTIALVVLNIMIPPKSIAVAMFAVEPAIQIAKDINDSNRTKSLVEILDLSIARVKENLEK